MRPFHKWSEEHYQFLKDNIKGIPYKDMIPLFKDRFNVSLTFGQLKGALARKNLTNGIDACYVKGNIPFNKGRKGHNQGGIETQFKKGSRPSNWRPIGSEKLRDDGYLWVKVQDMRGNKNWAQKHVHVYEKEHGPVPKGYCVIFADGSRDNFSLDNLILVKRSELLLMNKNKLIYKDSELTKVGAVIAKVMDRTEEVKR